MHIMLTYNLNTVQVDSDINVHFTGSSTKFALKLNPAKCIYIYALKGNVLTCTHNNAGQSTAITQPYQFCEKKISDNLLYNNIYTMK